MKTLLMTTATAGADAAARTRADWTPAAAVSPVVAQSHGTRVPVAGLTVVAAVDALAFGLVAPAPPPRGAPPV